MPTKADILDDLRDRRAAVITELRAIADHAEKSNGGVFTDADLSRVEGLKTELRSLTDQVKRHESLRSTQGQVPPGSSPSPENAERAFDGFNFNFRGTPGPGQPRSVGLSAGRYLGGKADPAARSPLGQAITAALFGKATGWPQDRDFTRPGGEARRGFDAYGNDVPSLVRSIPNGKATVQGPPVLRDTSGSTANRDLLLLAEPSVVLGRLVQTARLDHGDTYRYVVQTGTSGTTAAEFVPVGGKKPSAPMLYEPREGKVGTVAVLSDPLPRQDLEDVVGLPDDVGDWLAWQVARKVEWTILNGDSDTNPAEPNGVLNTEGVLAVEYQGSALASIRRAITRLTTAGVVPSAVVLSPADWESVEMLTDASGKPLFAGQFASAVARQLFGLPVVVTDLIADGSAVVGDWASALLLVRNSLDVSWSDAAARDVGGEMVSDWARNLVALRAEQRCSVEVLRPDRFAVVATTEGA